VVLETLAFFNRDVLRTMGAAAGDVPEAFPMMLNHELETFLRKRSTF